ncbi:MAG: hypothetical protein DYG94_08220 [Leptolyngbya sp. PLA3]|nr:MAG: hypothetical protein EDM82_09340 [Cyanobacteria bacterium CYA]MCE7968717.1 hypothetical protein [Leptolyngbya sp. PL-A3]
MTRTLAFLAVAFAGSAAQAGGFTNFDSLAEGFVGPMLTDGGITFFDLNNNSGVNPDGSNFGPGDYGTDFIIENATFAVNDFPGFLSGPNALSFGTAFMPGDNLSINILSTFSMTTGQVENAADMDLVYYENGPWGGIQLHLRALLNGSVVGEDLITISDLGGRDNPTGAHMSISGVDFDTLVFTAEFADGTATAFAGIFDNVSIVPAPGSALLVGLGGLGLLRRRR